MRRTHSSASLLAAAGILATATLLQAAPATEAPAKDSSTAKQSQKEPAKDSESAKANQSQQAPEGFVLVEEQLVTLTANEPQNHFLRAKEYLAQNDPRAAAGEVRISAAYLDMQASRKGEADQKDLRSASAHLRAIADRIAQGNESGKPGQEASKQPAASSATAKHEEAAKSGQSSEQTRLNHVFARAERVLAQHFQEQAKSELSDRKTTMAGEDLDAAASALDGSIAWSGQASTKECTESVADARRVSEALLTPVAAANTEGGTSHQQAGANNEAQPAAARLSARSESGSTEAARVPADAEKVIDELGKAIDSTGSKAAPDLSKDKKDQADQHSSTETKSK